MKNTPETVFMFVLVLGYSVVAAIAIIKVVATKRKLPRLIIALSSPK